MEYITQSREGKFCLNLRKTVKIAYLQETHLNDTEHAKLNRMGVKHVYSSSYKSGHKRGVAILISRRVNYEHLSELTNPEGRFVMIIGKLEGITVTFLNVYAAPGSDWMFYKKMFDLMVTKAQGVVICGGDFVMHLNPKLDVSSSKSEPKLINKRIIIIHFICTVLLKLSKMLYIKKCKIKIK